MDAGENKKRTAGSVSVSVSHPSSSTIEDLGDDLLEQIIFRLPTLSAFLCRFVSRRWRTIVSSCDFSPRRFLHLHSEEQLCFLLPENDSGQASILKSDGDKSLRLSLSFMPNRLENGDDEKIIIAASFNDLLLCVRHFNPCVYIYYVCNPFTKQWVQLPPLLHALEDTTFPFHEGLVCNQDRFVVLRLSATFLHEYTEARKFSSETGRWTSFPLDFRPPISKNTFIMGYKEQLFWIVEMGIVEFDSFRNSYCYDLDPTSNSYGPVLCVGVSGSSVRLFQLHHCRRTVHWFIWELEEASRGWELKHKFGYPQDSIFKGFCHDDNWDYEMRVVAFHPHDWDLIYLEWGGLVLLNLRLRTLQVLHHHLPTRTCQEPFFPLVLPPCFTPIPSITSLPQ